jgi:sugar phosphate isomerase/epimerase
METDADRVFDGLKKAGYAAIEGTLKDPAAFKQKLDARGLKHGGYHATPRPIYEKTQEIIDYLKTTGCTDVCNSGMLDWKHETLEQVRTSIKMLNEAGRKLRAAGIGLHYHNHDFEFTVSFEGKRIIDVLIAELDPSACDLCVDIAWVHRGGDDPAKFLMQHSDKVGYLHFKDWDGSKWVPLGKGEVDIKSVVKILPELKKPRWIMVEQDQADGDAMQNMAESRAYLTGLGV